MGIRHRINGTTYFIAGALLSWFFQFSVLANLVLGINEEIGARRFPRQSLHDDRVGTRERQRLSGHLQDLRDLGSRSPKALKEIQEKEQSRTLFFQNTSHELRTPLNGMIGFMQLLVQGRYGAIPQAAEHQLQKCIRLAISLKNQVNAILDLAKSKKGTLALNNSSILLDELASEAEDLADGLLLRRSDLSFKSQRVWPEAEGRFVGDREKLNAILRNLLGNAFKFTDPLRPNAVELQLRRDTKRLVIVVKDTGIGIPIEHQDKIFEEFQQISGDARRAYEGTGLGLAMVRDYVRLMGGSNQG